MFSGVPLVRSQKNHGANTMMCWYSKSMACIAELIFDCRRTHTSNNSLGLMNDASWWTRRHASSTYVAFTSSTCTHTPCPDAAFGMIYIMRANVTPSAIELLTCMVDPRLTTAYYAFTGSRIMTVFMSSPTPPYFARSNFCSSRGVKPHLAYNGLPITEDSRKHGSCTESACAVPQLTSLAPAPRR